MLLSVATTFLLGLIDLAFTKGPPARTFHGTDKVQTYKECSPIAILCCKSRIVAFVCVCVCVVE